MSGDSSPRRMIKAKPNKLIFWGWVFMASIFASGIIIQSQGLLGTDMSWLMHATKRFLEGGNYTHDFFEINPPTVLYIHVPPVLFASFFKLKLITSFRLYVFFIALLSILFSSHLLKQILGPTRQKTYLLLMIVLMLDYMLLPGVHFGQREHLATMLVMPYLLLSAIQSTNQSINKKLSFFIAIMAGMGFSIKPHFIFAFMLIELFLFIKAKTFKVFLRFDVMIIASIFVGSLASIFIVTPDYLDLIPYIRDFFSLYARSFDAWVLMLTNLKVTLVMLAAIIYLLFRHDVTTKALGTVLLISMIGFFLSYVVEPLFLNYHTIPMLSLAILLMVFLLCEYCFRLCSNEHFDHHKWLNMVILAAINVVVLAVPVYVIVAESRLVWVKKQLSPLNQFINLTKHLSNGEKIYFFSTDAAWTYPLVDYAGIESASRFESFWVLPYIFYLSTLNDDYSIKRRKDQETFFINTVIQDMKKGKPALVFVDNKVGWRLYDDVYFDYIQFFSQAKEFRDIWQNYRYISQIGEIKVYQRIDH